MALLELEPASSTGASYSSLSNRYDFGGRTQGAAVSSLREGAEHDDRIDDEGTAGEGIDRRPRAAKWSSGALHQSGHRSALQENPAAPRKAEHTRERSGDARQTSEVFGDFGS